MDLAGPETRFNTVLGPRQELQFQAWMAAQSKIRGRDISRDLANYDLRGYWREQGKNDTTGSGHFPDTWKKPNHPTFSDESTYHGTPHPLGGKYEGGKWTGDDKTGWKFTPSTNMAGTPESRAALALYFEKVEPDAKLEMPAPPLTVVPYAGSGLKVAPLSQ